MRGGCRLNEVRLLHLESCIPNWWDAHVLEVQAEPDKTEVLESLVQAPDSDLWIQARSKPLAKLLTKVTRYGSRRLDCPTGS